MSKILLFIQRQQWLRLGCYLLVACLVFGLLGAYAVPPLLKPWLEKQASAALQRDVKIGALSLNPFLFKLRLDRVVIHDQYGVFVSFKQLSLDAELSSIFRLAPVLREITLDEAQVNVIRLSKQQYNFSDLIKGGFNE